MFLQDGVEKSLLFYFLKQQDEDAKVVCEKLRLGIMQLRT